MTDTTSVTPTRSVLIERDLPHPPAKVWRALTQPHLIADWLTGNDFAPAAGHRFALQFDWGAVQCEVQQIAPHSTLVYSWDAGPLETVVRWTLTPQPGGTRLRMEQTGFRTDQPQFYGGAKQGWPALFDGIDRVLANLD